MIALALAIALQAQAAGDPVPDIDYKRGKETAASAPAQSGEPIPCLPGPCPGVEMKTKHDAVKNSVSNVKAVASDPIPGVDTPSPGPHGGK